MIWHIKQTDDASKRAVSTVFIAANFSLIALHAAVLFILFYTFSPQEAIG